MYVQIILKNLESRKNFLIKILFFYCDAISIQKNIDNYGRSGPLPTFNLVFSPWEPYLSVDIFIDIN